MGTKNNPGKYDCHAKAADDEPLFTLRAKDTLSPYIVELWVMMREWEIHQKFNDWEIPEAYKEKLAEARKVAQDMRKWREEVFLGSKALEIK